MSENAIKILVFVFLAILVIVGMSIIYAINGFLDGATYLILLAIFGINLFNFLKPQ